MKQQIILTFVVIAVAAFLGGYGLGSLNDNSNSLTTNEIINVSSESNTVDVDTITIGFIPVEKADELTPKAKELETFLENELGVDVEIVVPTNYETIIEGMRFGHIDAAFMDTGPAWITHQRTGAEVVLAELVAGKVNYQATVWTLANNDSINSLADTVEKKWHLLASLVHLVLLDLWEL